MLHILPIHTDEYVFSEHDALLKAVERHAQEAVAILDIKHDVTITVHPNASFTIISSGDGGYTPTKDWVQLSFDMTGKKFPQSVIIEHRVRPVVFHELAHVARHVAPGFGSTLREHLISEGLADVFEGEHCEHDVAPPYAAAEGEVATSQKVFEAYTGESYSYHQWFITGTDSLPQYAGHKLGFTLVSQYRAQHPNMSWPEFARIAADTVYAKLTKQQTQ